MFKLIQLKKVQNKFLYLSFCFSLFWLQPALAVSNSMVSVNDLTAGETTTYTFSFTTTSALDNADLASDAIVVETETGGPDFTAATLVSLTGGTITGSITSQNTTFATITLNGTGSANAGTTITVVLSGVLNPGTAGQGPDYTIRTAEFSTLPPAPTILEESFAGSVYTASNTPVVISPIADQNLDESDGTQVIVADLNTVFNDGDGDNLTFSVDPGHDSNITQVAINGDQLSLTPVSGGTTQVTIRATSVDGATTDTFSVSVIGELGNPLVTPADLDAGATANYSVSFTPDSPMETGQVILINSGVSGPDYSGASIVSISGGSGLTAVFFQPPTTQSTNIEITGGTANTNNTVVIVLSGLVNPGTAGPGPDYEMGVYLTDTGLEQIAKGTATGSVYNAVGEPTVTAPIANQNLNESLGETFVVADLNSVFTDGNGDPLTFSVVAGHDTAVVIVEVSGNQLTVTPTGPGLTTVTVKASDLPGGEGEVTDSFDVSVIGLMENATFSPQGFDSGVTTTYDLNFTSSSDFGDGYVIIISNDGMGGPDYSNATIGSLTANTMPLTAAINGQSTETISVEITNGAALVNDPISMTLTGVINPASGGTGPDYLIRLFRIPPPTGDVEQANLPGNNFIFGDLIFINGFEVTTIISDAMAKALVATISNDRPWLPQPSFSAQDQHYEFMGHRLSRDAKNTPRSISTVITWFETVLTTNQPWDDWDDDGIINELDQRPFTYD